jgi:hypothetical protein
MQFCSRDKQLQNQPAEAILKNRQQYRHYYTTALAYVPANLNLVLQSSEFIRAYQRI